MRSLLFASLMIVFISPLAAQDGKVGITFEMPLKTAIIKDPAATDPVAYFAGLEVLRFWVYKAGDTKDVQKILAAFREDKAVKTVAEGPATGDHKEFTVTLKSKQEKTWFRTTFTKAGVTHIKINNGPVTEISKL
jgi:hypothetical protein